MLPQSEAQIRGILSGAPKELDVRNIKFEGTNLRDVIRTVLKDEFASARKVRLTWNRAAEEDPKDPKYVQGELRKDGFPYIGPIGDGKYYIQNGVLYLSNGKRADMTKVSRTRKKLRDKDGNETELKSDMEWIEECMGSYLKTALALDVNLCPYCALVSPRTRKDYMEHVYKAHPKEFLADVQGNEESRVDIQADWHGEEAPPMPLVEETPRRRPKADPPVGA